MALAVCSEPAFSIRDCQKTWNKLTKFPPRNLGPHNVATMNTIKELITINDTELRVGITGTAASWHTQYQASSWVFVGNLPNKLTEGDVLVIMSQYGEVEMLDLQRDEDTGKSKGFAFLKYEDVGSTILAVDNFAGSKVLGRSIRVDHVEKYRLPKETKNKEDEEEAMKKDGTFDIYGGGGENAKKEEEQQQQQQLANENNMDRGVDLFAKPQIDEKKAEFFNHGYEMLDLDDENAGRGEVGVGSKKSKSNKKKEKKEKQEKKEDKKVHKKKKSKTK